MTVGTRGDSPRLDVRVRREEVTVHEHDGDALLPDLYEVCSARGPRWYGRSSGRTGWLAERLTATDVWWQVEVVRFNWRLATNGDASAQRWATIVTSLQALKAIDRLPAEPSGLLSEAEAELAKLQAY